MKILLSAYACEPNMGSEPGVGWSWALELARLGYEVSVLTRASNRATIEAELVKSASITNLNFLYYDLPLWARWWKKGKRGIHLYYFLWQWGAYLLAKKVHKSERFDKVHHITFVNIRQPSFMGNLGIPFVFGPVAGGERTPWRLRMNYGWRGWIRDGLRDLANLLVKVDPLARRTFKQAERIYVTSAQTLSLLPRKYRHKAIIQLAIGFNPSEMLKMSEKPPLDPFNKGDFKVLFVGNLLYLKGMHLGIPAFAHLLKKRPEARLTLVGRGPDGERWRTLAEKLGVGNRIDWVPWLDRGELPTIYASHDVLLFPSLHDSGGMVVLEAMAYGLPVVCLDLGGPGQTVEKTCGFKVKVDDLNEEYAIRALADGLIKLAKDSTFLCRLSEGAIHRAEEFRWSATVGRVYYGRNLGIKAGPLSITNKLPGYIIR
jgi:glycosyltransferase involved in cell wall biosynthesis